MSQKICVVNQDRLVSEPFAREIKRIFHDYLDVANYAMEDLLELPSDKIHDFSIFVVPCQSMKERVHSHFGEHLNIIPAKLTLAATNIEDLLSIQDGADVSVIMALEQTALNTIALLKDLGFNKLNYHGYWPGKEEELPDNIDVAITAGVPHLIKGNPARVINLGPRRLDLSTIFEIIYQLGLPTGIVNAISLGYITDLVKLSIKIVAHTRRYSEISTYLSNILNRVDAGIVALDPDNRVKFANGQAGRMLSYPISVGECLPTEVNELTEHVIEKKELKNKFLMLNNHRISLDVYPISLDSDDEIGSLAVLKYVSSIQEAEINLRTQLMKKGFIARYTFDDIVSSNCVLIEAVSTARKIALTDLNVLLFGESGVGKELFAQGIHNYSRRSTRPFVAINFAGLPANLIESELFGYVDGAFTGAKRGGRAGLFEQAHGGTLFLDEIGDASMETQIRLLRVIEEKRVFRIGGAETIPVDVRIVAATNKPLANLVKEGKFREDLFYRLNIAPIRIPPLRDRKGDIPLLIENILAENKIPVKFDEELLAFLVDYSWPGNVRQLKGVLQYLIAVNRDKNVIKWENAKSLLENLDTSGMKATDMKATETSPCQAIALLDEDTVVRTLLRVIRSSPGAGRGSLYKVLKQTGLRISEYKIRKAISFLEDNEYVMVGTTKQGMLITEKGLSKLEENICS